MFLSTTYAATFLIDIAMPRNASSLHLDPFVRAMFDCLHCFLTCSTSKNDLRNWPENAEETPPCGVRAKISQSDTPDLEWNCSSFSQTCGWVVRRAAKKSQPTQNCLTQKCMPVFNILKNIFASSWTNVWPRLYDSAQTTVADGSKARIRWCLGFVVIFDLKGSKTWFHVLLQSGARRDWSLEHDPPDDEPAARLGGRLLFKVPTTQL